MRGVPGNRHSYRDHWSSIWISSWRLPGWVGGLRRSRCLVEVIAACAIRSAAKQLHIVGNDLSAVTVLAGSLVLVLVRSDGAFNIDLRPLFQVFAGDFA